MTQAGSAHERTATSWGRTALGTAGLAILLLRLGIARHAWLEAAAGGIAAVMSGWLAWHGRLTYRRSADAPSALTMRAATSTFTVIALLAILGVL